MGDEALETVIGNRSYTMAAFEQLTCTTADRTSKLDSKIITAGFLSDAMWVVAKLGYDETFNLLANQDTHKRPKSVVADDADPEIDRNFRPTKKRKHARRKRGRDS